MGNRIADSGRMAWRASEGFHPAAFGCPILQRRISDVLRSVNGTASKCKTFLATATEECCPARGTLAGHFTRRLSPSPMPGKRIYSSGLTCHLKEAVRARNSIATGIGDMDLPSKAIDRHQGMQSAYLQAFHGIPGERTKLRRQVVGFCGVLLEPSQGFIVIPQVRPRH